MIELQGPDAQAADILVVDDETPSLRLLAEILARAGYKVRPVERPQVALESALAHLPGLILLDVRMPEMSGLELCRRLRQDERTREVPIIFVSALQDADDRAQGIEAGGVDFISKPFQEPEVLARVRTHLGLRSLQLHLEELVAERTAELKEANQALEAEIQERKQAQQALAESERTYRAVVEQAIEGILVMQDRQRKYCNPTWLDMIGYTAKEYAATPFLSLVHADDLGAVENAYQDLLNGQAFGPLPEFRITTKSGDVKWLAVRGSRIDWEGRPAGMVFISDVTRRKLAQEAVRESEARFRTVFDQAPMGIAVAGSDSRILEANEAFQGMVGYTLEELQEIEVVDLSPAQDNEREMPLVQEVLKGCRDTYAIEKRFKRKDGREIWTDTHAAAVRDEQGELWFAIAMTQDITERKRAEEALRQREAILGAVAFAAERFLGALDWQDEMDAVLDRLGTASGVSRVYVFQNQAGAQGEILTSQRFEWCVPGIAPQIDNPDLQDLPLRAGGFGRWEETLRRDGVIYGHVRAFPESERQALAVQGIRSMAVVPVSVGGRWWGFIGFDECARERAWSLSEQDALRAAASTLGAAIERKQTHLALQVSEGRYRTLVEQARDGIIVIQEGQIRFANSYVAELSGRTVKELLDTPFEGYLAADQLPKVADMYRRRMNGQAVPSTYESAFLHKDGSRVEVECSAGLTTYDGKPADQIIVRDIRERARAQRELQESQRLLSLVIDHVPALVSYVDKDRHYRFVNQRYEQAHGIPRSRFAGRHVREILGSEGYAAAEPRIAAVLAGKEISYEDVFENPEGGQRWMAVDYVPDKDRAGDVQGLIAMVTDITARKQAEQALKTSEAHLRRAQEVARAGSWELDLVNGGLFWSDEIYRIFGLPGETPMDYERFLDRVLPEDREYVDASWRAALERAAYDIEHRIAVGEEVKWVREIAEIEFDETGRAVRGLGIVQDITAHKQVEEELRKSKERLEEAQRTAQIGDWEYDIRAGKITWSVEMYHIFGVDAGRYVPDAKSDEEFCHPDDAPALRKAYERFFASGRDMDTDYRIVTPQGAVKSCRIRGRLILDEQGIPALAIGTTEDITARKLAEGQVIAYQERLRALAAELTLAEERERRRIAAELHDQVGQTLALVRIQLAAASRASSDARLVARLGEASESIRTAIQDTRELVFDLSSPLLNEIGLGAAVSEWLEAEIGAKHDLRTEFVDDGRDKPLDEDVRAILYRNVRELLTNVVRHAHASRVSVRLERAGTQVVVVVQDDGVGCDPNAVSAATQRGGGFGLFSIQERMADLGGSLEIVSAPGQGCTATLTAPLKLRGFTESE